MILQSNLQARSNQHDLESVVIPTVIVLLSIFSAIIATVVITRRRRQARQEDSEVDSSSIAELGQPNSPLPSITRPGHSALPPTATITTVSNHHSRNEYPTSLPSDGAPPPYNQLFLGPDAGGNAPPIDNTHQEQSR
jgi:hypothetical protein